MNRVVARLIVSFWLVSWTGHYFQPKPCESNTIVPNEYTGQPAPTTCCGDLVSKKMEKRFDVEDDAYNFAWKCPASDCTGIIVETVNE